ncbi:DUF7573 domain-containing protein [Haloarcula brevis]|uniref:DUF7573 domain-containing protein n=1 Tax=Haloarcula brevis TaxID=3111453 RepID=UPI00300F2EF0
MAEDASLEDFLDADTDSGDEGHGDSTPDSEDDGAAATGETASEEDGGTAEGSAGTADREDADAEGSSDAVDPAVTTYAWSPEGAACADCGEVVERRWTQGGVLVCGACKSW